VSLNIGGGVSCAISILFFLYSLFVERRKTELVKN
jgi:hypothetical protein